MHGENGEANMIYMFLYISLSISGDVYVYPYIDL